MFIWKMGFEMFTRRKLITMRLFAQGTRYVDSTGAKGCKRICQKF